MTVVTENINYALSVDALKSEIALSLFKIEAHPFVVEAHRGQLTLDKSLRWIMCAGRESRTFPKILENMLVYCRHPKIQGILQENLDDENGNGNPEHAHYQHYLHLLDNLGVSRDMFEKYPEKAGIRLAVDLALCVSNSGNLPLALGYMLVNEGMTPITYTAIKCGLQEYFPALKTQFFDMHISVDEKHVAELYRAVEELPSESMRDVLYGVAIGERGMAVLLDEVMGIFENV